MQEMTARVAPAATARQPAEAPRKWGWLGHAVIAAGLTIGVSTIGNLATIPQIPTWYAGLAKPSFNPPNWLFGPVWTVLFAIMAFAFWRILQKPPGTPGRRTAILVFIAQLALNALWSIVFFGLHQPGLAIGVVVLLEIGVLAMIASFRRLDPLAGWIDAPYAVWVAFATILNVAIVSLNGMAP